MKAITANCIGFSITAILIAAIFIFYDNSKGLSIYTTGGAYDIENHLDSYYRNYEFVEAVALDLKAGGESTVFSSVNEVKGVAFSAVSLDEPVAYVFSVTDEDGHVETREGMLHEKNCAYFEMRRGVDYKLVCSAEAGPVTAQLNVYLIR